jgi:hypothetical protein
LDGVKLTKQLGPKRLSAKNVRRLAFLGIQFREPSRVISRARRNTAIRSSLIAHRSLPYGARLTMLEAFYLNSLRLPW